MYVIVPEKRPASFVFGIFCRSPASISIFTPKTNFYNYREERTEFIRCKYVEKKYVAGPVDQESLSRRMELAIDSDDLQLLVRTWAQGASLGQPLPQNVNILFFGLILKDCELIYVRL